ncbi:hypothetical protein PISMIDRAFT_690446, partial [Pisolithus microcarpus 441]
TKIRAPSPEIFAKWTDWAFRRKKCDISRSIDADTTERAPFGRSRRGLLGLQKARGLARQFSR